MKFRPRAPKAVRSIVTSRGVNAEGKPTVTIGLDNRYATLDADEVERLCEHLQSQLAAARREGEV